MTKIVLLMAFVGFAACSSKTKPVETAMDTQSGNKTMETASAPVVETVKDKKTSKKEMVKEMPAEAAPAASTGTELPAITGTEKSTVTCTNKSDSRKISVLNVTEGGCGVVYNKMGADKTVAIAKADMNHCDNVSGKIKTNLEGAGFNCGSEQGTSTDTAEQKQ